MGEAACRGPSEHRSPGPNLALNGPGQINLRHGTTTDRGEQEEWKTEE